MTDRIKLNDFKKFRKQINFTESILINPQSYKFMDFQIKQLKNFEEQSLYKQQVQIQKSKPIQIFVMGCASSYNQVNQVNYSMSSSKPLSIDQMFQSSNPIKQLNKVLLFGQTQTKRKILQLALNQKTSTLTLTKISQRYHIPRPKIQRDTIEMMYEQAQQVIPLNMFNSTTLPPFNQMFVALLNQKLIFLCGGVDFQFWNVCAQSFLYKINSSLVEDERTIKIKPQKPQSNIVSQRQGSQKQNSSKRNFNKFERLSFMNQGRYSHMGLSLKHPITGKNLVYVFGGFGSNKETLKSCQVYSFEKNTWQRIADMSIPRATGFCFHYLDKIYVCGGFTSKEKRSKKIQVFDLTIDKWTILNVKMHHGIQQGFITSFRPNEILIMGGNTIGGPIKSAVRVNLIEETYKWDSDMIYSDTLQKAIHYSNKVYLLGGTNPKIYQIYDSKSLIWTQVKLNHSQEVKSNQLTLFSSLNMPLYVDFVPFKGRRKFSDQNFGDFLLIGTDHYPLIQCYHENDLLYSSRSVPMKLRLRKEMGVLRLSQNEYFICGGVDSLQMTTTKATFNYNSATNLAEQLDKMPIKKYRFGMIKHKNHIYTIGGAKPSHKGGVIQIKDCSRYNLLTKKWEKLPQLNTKRSQCQILSIQKGLIIFGGYLMGQWVDTIEYLDTQSQKPLTFELLTQKIPLLFPFYNKIISQDQKGKTLIKIFTLNHNIHSNNFEQVYFEVNIDRIQKRQSSEKKKTRNLQVNTLQHFDSIDMIINERVKSAQRHQQSGKYPFKMKSELLTDEKIKKEQNRADEKMDNKSREIKKSQDKERMIYKDKIEQVKSKEQKREQPISVPKPQVIQIRSKQMDEIQEVNLGDSIEEEQINQIEEGFVDDKQRIDQMSVQYEKLTINQNNFHHGKRSLNDHQNMVQPNAQFLPLSANYQSLQIDDLSDKPIKQTIPDRQQQINQQPNFNQPYFIPINTKQIVKGLQIIKNPNQWVKLKESSNGIDRIIFVQGLQVVKCSFTLNKDQQINTNIVKERYQNSDFFNAQRNGSETQININSQQLKQNYA